MPHKTQGVIQAGNRQCLRKRMPMLAQVLYIQRQSANTRRQQAISKRSSHLHQQCVVIMYTPQAQGERLVYGRGKYKGRQH
jgi:hypothetical protein